MNAHQPGSLCGRSARLARSPGNRPRGKRERRANGRLGTSAFLSSGAGTLRELIESATLDVGALKRRVRAIHHFAADESDGDGGGPGRGRRAAKRTRFTNRLRRGMRASGPGLSEAKERHLSGAFLSRSVHFWNGLSLAGGKSCLIYKFSSEPRNTHADTRAGARTHPVNAFPSRLSLLIPRVCLGVCARVCACRLAGSRLTSSSLSPYH